MIKRPSKIAWNSIEEVGYPPVALSKGDFGCDRKFLVRCEYSIETACLFPDRSGFDLPDSSTDTPNAWAVIEGF